MKDTISNKRSHLVAKAREIVAESYGLDVDPLDVRKTKWLVDSYRFMHRDPSVCPWLLDSRTVANPTPQEGSAILQSRDHRIAIQRDVLALA